MIACCLFEAAVFCQSDRASITGVVVDPAGAVVANAPVEARNVETGTRFQAATTPTGNNTLAELPVGTYEVAVAVPGFKRAIRQGLRVEVAQTIRIDITLEVGSASDSVTVADAAPLPKTESGELSHNISTDRIDDLPILQVGGNGSGGIRNPLAAVQLAPGVAFTGNTYLRVNGAPANSQSIRIEGQDATNGYLGFATPQVQPRVDAIQEVSVQTSNYAAEFGQVGGGFLNYTMKSGTNQLHGSGYDYFVNEALNAGTAWTNDGTGSHVRPVQRRNNYGATFGGPVWLPKVYDGHDKTFFFFNFEEFRETVNNANNVLTVPTAEMRAGNFQSILTGRQLGTDSATGAPKAIAQRVAVACLCE